jgi:hypothetical protein
MSTTQKPDLNAPAQLKEGLARLEKLERDAKRSGRPIKAARRGRRYRISVDISGPTKALITARAKASGRTLAREAEIMIEGFVVYLEMQERTGTTIEEIGRVGIEVEIRRRGYEPVNTPDGIIYTPQNFPLHLYLRPANMEPPK